MKDGVKKSKCLKTNAEIEKKLKIGKVVSLNVRFVLRRSVWI